MDSNEPRTFLSSCNAWLASRTGLLLLAAIGVLLGYVVYRHRLHVLAFFPYLVVLACPLMHLFHHRGHGHRHGGERKQQ